MFNVIKVYVLLSDNQTLFCFLFPNVYSLAHFGEQGSMISAIKLRRYHVLLLHNDTQACKVQQINIENKYK